MAIHPTGRIKKPDTAKEGHEKYGPYISYSPQCMAYYFDVETKLWKPLPSVAQLDEKTGKLLCAEYNGNYLYVATQQHEEAGNFETTTNFVYRYHIVNNSWVKLPQWTYNHEVNCLCSVDDYIYAISESNRPQRYSLTDNIWQAGDRLNFIKTNSGYPEELHTVAATVMNSKIYVIHDYQTNESPDGRYAEWVNKPAVVHCFDPARNEWYRKASTCHPHFGSSLFAVNNRLCVAGGNISWENNYNYPCDNAAPVEVYDNANETWTVVQQKHIPPNNLGALEIERRVYSIINKFPIDSEIRIPLGELYHVHLKDWEQLAEVSYAAAVLCYLPDKRENLR